MPHDEGHGAGERRQLIGGGNGMMGGMNAWWIFGVIVVVGVLWLVFKSFGQQKPPGSSS